MMVRPRHGRAVLFIWVLVALIAIRTLLTIVLKDNLADAYAEQLFSGSWLTGARTAS